MDIQFKNLGNWPQEDIPAYATTGAAAMDLRAFLVNQIVVHPGQVVKVPTGIAISIGTPTLAAHILPRSGNGTNKGMVLANLTGLIDSDYQGELIVAVWNRSNEPFSIKHGDRIAQLEFVRVEQVSLVQVDEFAATKRGDGGFGSTGG